VLVDGPVNSGNGALDYDSAAVITGGVVIATGSSGMAMNFSQADGQASILAATGNQNAGTSVAVVDESGKAVVSFTPSKSYQCVLVSAPGLQSGESYELVFGGSVKGTDEHGFAEAAAISGGSTLSTIEVTQNVTNSGISGGMGGMMGPGGTGGQMPGSQFPGQSGQVPGGQFPAPSGQSGQSGQMPGGQMQGGMQKDSGQRPDRGSFGNQQNSSSN